MPLIDLFIFPIMGGYYILIRSERYRYRQQRVEPQKLVFNSILAGIIVLIISWIIALILFAYLPNFMALVKSFLPIKRAYFGTCSASFFLAVVGTEVTNWIFIKDRQVSKAIKEIGNEFEILCEDCYRNVDLIQVTLKNEKVYVGLVKSLPIPQHSNYLRIFPVYSGYRDLVTKKLEFTTQYLDVYQTYIADGSAYDIREITSLVVKIDEILTATKFHADLYDRFLSQEEKDNISENQD